MPDGAGQLLFGHLILVFVTSIGRQKKTGVVKNESMLGRPAAMSHGKSGG